MIDNNEKMKCDGCDALIPKYGFYRYCFPCIDKSMGYNWDIMEQKHKWQCRPTIFHIGYMDFGMKWGIILFGKKIYEKETNWRERLKNEKTKN